MRLPGGREHKFKCPLCGGSSFGSAILDPNTPVTSRMHRYCHGDDAGDGVAGCTFNWPDEDDWKYFLVDGIRLSETAYASVQEEDRKIQIEGVEEDYR
jgi:hypothetical protein